MTSLIVGISSLACLLGFLVGASESPVAGLAITATFGIFATCFALYDRIMLSKKSKANEQAESKEKISAKELMAFRQIGVSFIAFTLLFSLGMGTGIYVKFQITKHPIQKGLPWADKPPKSARDAIDWILVREELIALGYTEAQISSIYLLYAKQDNDDESLSDEERKPISPLFYKPPFDQESVPKHKSAIAWDPNIASKEKAI